MNRAAPIGPLKFRARRLLLRAAHERSCGVSGARSWRPDDALRGRARAVSVAQRKGRGVNTKQRP